MPRCLISLITFILQTISLKQTKVGVSINHEKSAGIKQNIVVAQDSPTKYLVEIPLDNVPSGDTVKC